jgi:hypothetical protein
MPTDELTRPERQLYERRMRLADAADRAIWKSRARAQRLMNNNRAAEATGDVPTSAADVWPQRPRERRFRRSRRSSAARGDPDPEPEPDLVSPAPSGCLGVLPHARRLSAASSSRSRPGGAWGEEVSP